MVRLEVRIAPICVLSDSCVGCVSNFSSGSVAEPVCDRGSVSRMGNWCDWRRATRRVSEQTEIVGIRVLAALACEAIRTVRERVTKIFSLHLAVSSVVWFGAVEELDGGVELSVSTWNLCNAGTSILNVMAA